MKIIHIVAFILLVLGGLVWGLIGFLDINILDHLFGGSSIIPKIIYSAIGLGTVVEVLIHPKVCNACQTKFAPQA